ncbi:MAG: hypothetical protein, partial [Olavius algarvensis Gamma 1 endosymbiont]
CWGSYRYSQAPVQPDRSDPAPSFRRELPESAAPGRRRNS